MTFVEAKDGARRLSPRPRRDGAGRLRLLLICLLLSTFLPGSAVAGSAAVMPGFERLALADYLKFWVDETGSADIDEVRGLPSSAWTPTRGPFASNLPGHRPIWVRIALSNPSTRGVRGLLSLDNHLQADLTVYEPIGDEGRRVSASMGLRDVDRRARTPIYSAFVPGQATETWYVRLEPDALMFSATLWEETAYAEFQRQRASLLGVMFGGILAVMLIAVAISWWARLRRARGFEFFAATMLASLLISSGEHLIWPLAFHRLSYAVVALQLLSVASFLVFCRNYLDTRSLHVRLDQAFLGAAALLGAAAMVASIDVNLGIVVGTVATAIGMALPLVAAVLGQEADRTRTVVFLVGYAPLLAGYLVPTLVFHGLIGLELSPMALQAMTWPASLALFGLAAAGSGVQAMKQQALELRRSEEELREYAYKDRLTGVANRAALLDALQARLIQVADTGHPFALVFMDLDRFKNVNDVFGHGVGDEMLRRIGSRLVATVRAEDTVARLGGDEFVVLLHSVPDEAAARAEAERLLEVLAHPLMLRRQQIRTSASAGITLVRNPGARPDDLLSEADMAMHAAKSEGKGRVQTFDIALRGSAQERLELESELHEALKNNQLEMHFQPILRASDTRTVGFEALMRWHHPERGWISPGAFIPVAEETGLIQELGAFALEQATAAIARWNNLTRGNLFVTVNVSSRQFVGRQVSSQVRRSLALAGCKPNWLKIELTESLLVTDFTLAQQELGRIHDLGVGLCLDDFGTGYSSLSYLHQLPLTTIKIDQAFCRDITDKPSSQAIVASVVALANGLEMDVVSEGVETVEDKAMLSQLGTHFMQGYLFGKPIAMHAVPDYLDADISVSDRRQYEGQHSDKTIEN